MILGNVLGTDWVADSKQRSEIKKMAIFNTDPLGSKQ